LRTTASIEVNELSELSLFEIEFHLSNVVSCVGQKQNEKEKTEKVVDVKFKRIMTKKTKRKHTSSDQKKVQLGFLH